MANGFDDYWRKQDLVNVIVRHFQEHAYAQRVFAKKLGITLHQVRNLILRRTQLFQLIELERFVKKINEDR